MKTETIQVDDKYGKEYAGTYVFKEITWAKRSRIIHKNTTYHPSKGHVMKTDYVAIQADTIIASLQKQPEKNPITIQKLLDEDEGIPVSLGEFFSKIVNKLCGVTKDETKKS